MSFKTKGMNQDLSVSAFNPEFSFENMNLRLSTNESNTMMSWVNERGTAQLGLYKEDPHWSKDGEDTVDGAYTDEVAQTLPHGEGTAYSNIQEAEADGWSWNEYSETSIEGVPVGTAVLNHKLVLFTTEGTADDDHIYTIEYIDDGKTQLLVTEKYGQNIGLDENHPLETLVSYESEKIQKVYWVDGKNQPRVINIAAEGIADKPNTFFDFIPTLQLKEEVTVKKILGGNGTFAPGVIQYAFTYYNKYGQESNIFYTTPLCYISHKDRGASPEDKVDNVFKISVRHPDTNYDYLRIYSIQRTSINGTPIVKRIQDISMKDYSDSNSPITREYASSELIPIIHANGSTINPAIIHSSESTINVLPNTSAECYGFVKSGFSDLKITIGDWNISFVNTATQDSVIWITKNKISYNGVYAYYIIGTTNQGATTQEGISMVLIEEPCLTYTDTGTSGNSVDPTELLYKGGESIIANTIEQKDGTLFLGNFKNERMNLNLLKESIKGITTVDSEHTVNNNTVPYTRQIKAVSVSTGNYSYANQLTATNVSGTTNIPCGGFKRGDYYRCGVQFQHKSGKWSDPIYINDVEVKGTPSIDTGTNTITLPVLKGHINNESGIPDESTTIGKLINGGYRRARPVVLFPEMKDRVTLFQGVAAPTVYTNDRRIGSGTVAEPKGDLYAQSSWFFRTRYDSNTQISNDGTVAPYYGVDDNDHIPYAYAGIRNLQEYNPETIRGVEIQGDFSDDNRFKVDNTLLTLHSPDIEFDTQLWNTSFENTKGYKIGKALISNTWSDINIQTETPTISEKGAGFTHKSFSKANSYGIVSGPFYEDFAVDDGNHLEAWTDEQSAYKWMVYPWNKDGSLNNDINRPSNEGTPTAILKKKAISNLRITNTSWLSSFESFSFSGNPELFTSEEVSIVKVDGKVYEGNIDTMLTPDVSDGMYFAHDDTDAEESADTLFTTPITWKTYSKNPGHADQQGLRIWNNNTWDWTNSAIGNDYVDLVMKKAGVRMKYKSTPHVVFKQYNSPSLFGDNYTLPIVEIRRTADTNFLSNIYGGTSTDALKENNWIPCGEPVPIYDSNNAPLSNIEFEYSYGDTYFQRWDCLKTYAFTKEDTNQVVEIGSFMLESRINCDGRYDRNRGQVNNTNMSPQNFNLMNPVYSQIDNFFSYKILDDSYYENTNYLNQITWSKTKESGADIDLWTNITLASVLELDGDKGELNKLIRFNNYLFAFQDRGISQILYNDNVQIQSTQGVPIEIANSGKVSGKDYKSSSIGCSNKWSMVTTPNGIYFMDSNDKSIYLFNGQLANISNAGGFNSWCKLNIPSSKDKWTPVPYEKNQQGINIGGFENFVGYYDQLNQDVLYINHKTALAWSEKMQAFTSFYDYGNTPFFVNLDDTGIWINKDLSNDIWKLWRHQAGYYCKFFGRNMPYWMTLVGNPEPQASKLFTNLEFRACVENEGLYPGGEESNFNPYTPFDTLDSWNEYQHGFADMIYQRNSFSHHSRDNNASLKRRFRIWRCDIPRDNADLSTDADFGVTRVKKHPSDRMCNPWLYMKLLKKAKSNPRESLQKTEIHDIVMTYFT